MPGASRGSDSRQARAPRRSAASPMAWWKASTRSVAARSEGSPATNKVPSARKCTGWPAAASSAAAKPGQARTAARLSAASDSSPNCASATGASMPAAAQVEPRPGSGSTTVTDRPADTARHAMARPMIPPPTTTTSRCPVCVMGSCYDGQVRRLAVVAASGASGPGQRVASGSGSGSGRQVAVAVRWPCRTRVHSLITKSRTASPSGRAQTI